MMKWALRPPAMAARNYKVKVKPLKLELMESEYESIDDDDNEEEEQPKVMAIKVKWKGEPKFGLVPFNLGTKNPRRDFTKEKTVRKKASTAAASGGGRWAATIVEWDDDDEFENVCGFTVVVSDGHERLGPWDVSFSVLYGDEKKRRKKMAVIGRATLNLAEMAARKKMESAETEAKLPINLSFGGMSVQANLLVRLDFVEIRDPNSAEPSGLLPEPELRPVKPDDRSPPQSSSSSVEQNEIQNEAKAVIRSSDHPQLESAKKIMGLFSWKKRRLSFKPTSEKESGQQRNTGSSSTVDSVISGSPRVEGAWELKEVTSRDGKAKLKTSVFFASFDQCSNKAAGESACTALVAVIAHWLQVNGDAMPARPEFNALILEGSSEWRKLCENDSYTNDFPNKHFDLETVLRADIRPITISRDDSFVGFFSPEKFESLKGAMSFDEIWDGINRICEEDHEPRIYIVSWNDHFFVLKVEANAYYIIDTLGERLFEGCSQAYILRFDDSSVMYGRKSTSIEIDNTDEMERVCSGKECCKEFIKRFLAAIPIMELESEEEKGAAAVSYYSLHHRLQIELNSTYLLSSSKSSPFSSSSNSASSSSSSSTDKCP